MKLWFMFYILQHSYQSNCRYISRDLVDYGDVKIWKFSIVWKFEFEFEFELNIIEWLCHDNCPMIHFAFVGLGNVMYRDLYVLYIPHTQGIKGPEMTAKGVHNDVSIWLKRVGYTSPSRKNFILKYIQHITVGYRFSTTRFSMWSADIWSNPQNPMLQISLCLLKWWLFSVRAYSLIMAITGAITVVLGHGSLLRMDSWCPFYCWYFDVI